MFNGRFCLTKTKLCTSNRCELARFLSKRSFCLFSLIYNCSTTCSRAIRIYQDACYIIRNPNNKSCGLVSGLLFIVEFHPNCILRIASSHFLFSSVKAAMFWKLFYSVFFSIYFYAHGVAVAFKTYYKT